MFVGSEPHDWCVAPSCNLEAPFTIVLAVTLFREHLRVWKQWRLSIIRRSYFSLQTGRTPNGYMGIPGHCLRMLRLGNSITI